MFLVSIIAGGDTVGINCDVSGEYYCWGRYCRDQLYKLTFLHPYTEPFCADFSFFRVICSSAFETCTFLW